MFGYIFLCKNKEFFMNLCKFFMFFVFCLVAFNVHPMQKKLSGSILKKWAPTAFKDVEPESCNGVVAPIAGKKCLSNLGVAGRAAVASFAAAGTGCLASASSTVSSTAISLFNFLPSAPSTLSTANGWWNPAGVFMPSHLGPYAGCDLSGTTLVLCLLVNYAVCGLLVGLPIVLQNWREKQERARIRSSLPLLLEGKKQPLLLMDYKNKPNL
jgi:hypothetical protein